MKTCANLCLLSSDKSGYSKNLTDVKHLQELKLYKKKTCNTFCHFLSVPHFMHRGFFVGIFFELLILLITMVSCLSNLKHHVINCFLVQGAAAKFKYRLHSNHRCYLEH